MNLLQLMTENIPLHHLSGWNSTISISSKIVNFSHNKNCIKNLKNKTCGPQQRNYSDLHVFVFNFICDIFSIVGYDYLIVYMPCILGILICLIKLFHKLFKSELVYKLYSWTPHTYQKLERGIWIIPFKF